MLLRSGSIKNTMPNLQGSSLDSTENCTANNINMYHQFVPVNISVPSYDGSPNTLKFFIEQLQNVKDIQNLSEEHILFILKSKLTGNALQYYLTSPSCENITTLAQAHEVFKSFFIRESSASTNLVNFQSIRLLPQETIKNLAHRIDAAAGKTYTAVTDPRALGQIKVLQFLTALPADLRSKVIDHDTTNYDATVKLAQRFQDNQRSSSLLDSQSVATCSHVDTDPNILLQAEINALRQDLNKLNIHANPIPKPVNNILCQLCNSPLHAALSCPLLAQTVPSSQPIQSLQPAQTSQLFEASPGYTSPSFTPPLFCHFCNRQGHAWAECHRYARMHRQFAQPPPQFQTHRPPTSNRGYSQSYNRFNRFQPRQTQQDLNYQRRQ